MQVSHGVLDLLKKHMVSSYTQVSLRADLEKLEQAALLPHCSSSAAFAGWQWLPEEHTHTHTFLLSDRNIKPADIVCLGYKQQRYWRVSAEQRGK